MAKLNKINVGEYVAPFQHEGIRTLLSTVVAAEDYAAMAPIFTLGGFAAGDSGYPKGGSLRIAQNMADTFVRLGGKLELKKSRACQCGKWQSKWCMGGWRTAKS